MCSGNLTSDGPTKQKLTGASRRRSTTSNISAIPFRTHRLPRKRILSGLDLSKRLGKFLWHRAALLPAPYMSGTVIIFSDGMFLATSPLLDHSEFTTIAFARRHSSNHSCQYANGA